MPMYMFHLCRADEASTSFEAFELADDGDAFTKASELLRAHLTGDHVAVWQDDRAVLALHREQPILRPVTVPA